MRRHTPATETIFYQGCVADQAITAPGQLAASNRNIAVLAVMSADRLNAGWTAALRERRRGNRAAQSHTELLFSQVARDASIVTLIDGHPATLAWLGGVAGHRTVSLGAEHFLAKQGRCVTCTDIPASTRGPSQMPGSDGEGENAEAVTLYLPGRN